MAYCTYVLCSILRLRTTSEGQLNRMDYSLLVGNLLSRGDTPPLIQLHLPSSKPPNPPAPPLPQPSNSLNRQPPLSQSHFPQPPNPPTTHHPPLLPDPPSHPPAHTTQFTEPGYVYLKLGSGAGHLKNGGSYVTLMDPNTHDLTIIIETVVSVDV